MVNITTLFSSCIFFIHIRSTDYILHNTTCIPPKGHHPDKIHPRNSLQYFDSSMSYLCVYSNNNKFLELVCMLSGDEFLDHQSNVNMLNDTKHCTWYLRRHFDWHPDKTISIYIIYMLAICVYAKAKHLKSFTYRKLTRPSTFAMLFSCFILLKYRWLLILWRDECEFFFLICENVIFILEINMFVDRYEYILNFIWIMGKRGGKSIDLGKSFIQKICHSNFE